MNRPSRYGTAALKVREKRRSNPGSLGGGRGETPLVL